MKTQDFTSPITSRQLNENMFKKFGVKVDLNRYSREELENYRNLLRTKINQQESQSNFNDLLTNEDYQKDKHLATLLNTRIKEMLGESIAVMERKLDTAEKKKKEEIVKAIKRDNPEKRSGKGKSSAHAIATAQAKKVAEGSKKDQTNDGKSDFDDVQVARMTAGGVPKKKAIAKATSDDMKEGFPTVADAKARHEKEKTTGKFNKKTNPQNPSGTIYTKKHTKADAEPEKANEGIIDKVKSAVGLGKKPHNAEYTKYKADLAKRAEKIPRMASSGNDSADYDYFTGRDKVLGGEKNVKEGSKNLPGNQEKIDVDHDGKIEKSDLAKLRAGKKKMKESQHKQNVKIVNENVLRLLSEDEEGKAKTITAGADMVNDFTSWMTRIGQYQTKSMIELADTIRANFGQNESEQFKSAVAPALETALNTLTQAREEISNAVAVLAGEAPAADPMGSDMGGNMDMTGNEEIPDAGMDSMNMGDEFGASDAAAGGAEISGRSQRESRELFARKLSEAHSIIGRLSK